TEGLKKDEWSCYEDRNRDPGGRPAPLPSCAHDRSSGEEKHNASKQPHDCRQRDQTQLRGAGANKDHGYDGKLRRGEKHPCALHARPRRIPIPAKSGIRASANGRICPDENDEKTPSPANIKATTDANLAILGRAYLRPSASICG